MKALSFNFVLDISGLNGWGLKRKALLPFSSKISTFKKMCYKDIFNCTQFFSYTLWYEKEEKTRPGGAP